MDFFKGMLSFFTGLFTNQNDFWNNITVNSGLVFWVIFIAFLLVFCACASYEFMNSIGKNAKVAFWIGLFIPIIAMIVYLAIMIKVKYSAVVAAKQALQTAEEERAIREAEQARIDSTPSKENFMKIKANNDGKFDGPFKLELTDGSSLTVDKVVEVQDTLVVMELVQTDPNLPKVLRMPFAKMVSITKIS